MKKQKTYTSKEIIKVKPAPNTWQANIAPLGQKPRWIILTNEEFREMQTKHSSS